MKHDRLQAFAEELDGIKEYPISKKYIDRAKEFDIVIVYGESDDLIEFDGAYTEEAGGVFDGGVITFDENGTSDDGKEHANTIKAFWCGKCGDEEREYTATWEYETDIWHETFRMYDGDELYCKGIVFCKGDMK